MAVEQAEWQIELGHDFSAWKLVCNPIHKHPHNSHCVGDRRRSIILVANSLIDRVYP
jgi:hypothetical protein